MGRPKRVFPKNLKQFDKLHTRKIRMMSGVEVTGLHIIKTTPEYYISIDSWAASCNQYKQKIKYAELKTDIPVITDTTTIDFLDSHAWHDWVQKELDSNDTDMIETLAFLNKLFPTKKMVYFYELNSILHSFNWGTFVSYDKNDCIETPDEHDIERQKQINSRYNDFNELSNPEVKKLYNAYHNVPSITKGLKTKAYKKYANARDEYNYNHNNQIDTFITIGENSIVCPYAFTKCCVEGSAYENAGDIYFVVTPDTVYFETQRHF